MKSKIVYIILTMLLLATVAALGQYTYMLNTRLDALLLEFKDFDTKLGAVSQTSFDVGDIYNKAEQSVVKIEITRTLGRISGSGFFFDSNGRIVTNNHVVEEAGPEGAIEVVLSDGSTVKGKILGQDAQTDLAVIEIAETNKRPPIKLADSEAIKVGEQVVAIGSPFGLGGSITSGIISQKGRLMPAQGGYSVPNILQFDAPINPGNSGGPLLNTRGEVLGVTTAIMTRGDTASFAGVGFAIPSNAVSRVIPALIAEGRYKHPWLGIVVTGLRPNIIEAMSLKVSKGLLITGILPNGPADNAGLRAGTTPIAIDFLTKETVTIGGDVIIAIDNLEIRNMEDLLSYLSQKTPGDTASVKVIRDGNEMTVKATVGVRPATSPSQTKP